MATYKKLVAVSLSTKFREVVKVQTASVPSPGPGELLVRCRYAGINASDINWTAGRYFDGASPPIDAGFEGLGTVVETGADCSPYKPGDVVCYVMLTGGAFAEYGIVPANLAFPVPKCDPLYVGFLGSAPTASISLEKVGEMKEGETVLVTAAAGGTGQFAVQLAKLAGCHVIGTCSTDKKVEFLRGLGCDRPINYKKEDLDAILKKEYPKGVDLVYESVGGEMFNTCAKNLAVNGRLMIIGIMSSYQSGDFAFAPGITLNQILLQRSASVRGFFMPSFMADYPSHYGKLMQLYADGKLKCSVDLGQNCSKGPFKGVESVYDAVNYLYSGQSSGKVVVELNPE